MKTKEEMEKMLSLAAYRYDESSLDAWLGWQFALMWIMNRDEEEDYQHFPKTKEEAKELAKELKIPLDWIG